MTSQMVGLDFALGRRTGRSSRSFIVAPLAAMAVAVVAYYLVADLVSGVEAAIVGSVGPSLNPLILGRSGHSGILVAGSPDAFVAQITRSCSAAVPMAVQIGVGAFLLPGRRNERFRAISIAVVLVAVANVLRILGIVLVGASQGPGVLVAMHDWIGTVISFTAAAAGLLLMVHLLTPSSEEEQ